MIEYRTITDDILIGIYLNGNRGNIVYAAGMPQTMDKYHPLVMQAQRLGYNLFVPRYRGTFESGGDFSLAHSVETLEKTILLVSNGSTRELFAGQQLKWEKAPTYLLGFSYGALPSLLQSQKVNKVVCVCPFALMNFHGTDCEGEDVAQTYRFLQIAYPYIYRLNAEAVCADLNQVKMPDKLTNSTLLVYGTEDKSIPDNEITSLSQRYHLEVVAKQTGHSISMTDELFLTLFS